MNADGTGLIPAQHCATLELFEKEIAPALRQEIPSRPFPQATLVQLKSPCCICLLAMIPDGQIPGPGVLLPRNIRPGWMRRARIHKEPLR